MEVVMTFENKNVWIYFQVILMQSLLYYFILDFCWNYNFFKVLLNERGIYSYTYLNEIDK